LPNFGGALGTEHRRGEDARWCGEGVRGWSSSGGGAGSGVLRGSREVAFEIEERKKGGRQCSEVRNKTKRRPLRATNTL